jgi:hypothetical protein
MVSFGARLLLGKEIQLSYLSYKTLCMLSFDENVDSAWIKYLKTLIDHTSYSGIWRNQDFPNSNWLISGIKLRLQDQFKRDWYSLIEHSRKASNYRIFKYNFESENYLRILVSKDIYTLCKFITTNHRLPIETGRWNIIPGLKIITTFDWLKPYSRVLIGHITGCI